MQNIIYNNNKQYQQLFLKCIRVCKFDLGYEKYNDSKEILKQLFYNNFTELSRMDHDRSINDEFVQLYKIFDQRAFNKVPIDYLLT